MIIVEYVGVKMDFQIQLLIIDSDHVYIFTNLLGRTLNLHQR
jgi:hypothetical protein